MATTGKNEPCYCGSGLTFGECCLKKEILDHEMIGVKSPIQDILPGHENHVFTSLEEAQEAAQRKIDHENRTPLKDFCGLSPEEMFIFLYHPFNYPELVFFNKNIKTFPESPFFRLFTFLINAANKDELKATAKGMLPVKLVRDAALWFYGEEAYRDRKRYMIFRTETDFPAFHTVRLISVMSGFMRKFRGKFILTKEGATLAERGMDGAAFYKIFETYTCKFNWSYNDRCPELPIIQQTFLFTLYLLVKFGEEFRPVSFYEELFQTAFPHAIKTVPEISYETPDETLNRSFSLRSIARFCHFLGFVEVDESETRWIEKRWIKKTYFLDEWVRFRRQQISQTK